MKKLLICLLCVNFITFLSFASSVSSETSNEPEPGLSESSDHITVQIYDNSVDASIDTTEITDIEEDLSPAPYMAENYNYNNSHEDSEPVSEDVPVPEYYENETQAGLFYDEKNEKKENYGAEGEMSQYPALGDIEEPDIITLEPVSDNEDENLEELVEADLPPLSELNEEDEEENVDKDEEESLKETLEETSGKEELEPKPVIETSTETISEKQETVQENQQSEVNNEAVSNEEITEEEIEPVIDIIKPSRSATLKRREYIDITYPGSGWIYTGIVDGSKDLSYFGRALGTENTTFTLQAIVPGTKLLHFCKNDYLTGDYIDDYIEVIILEEEGSNKTHVEAPDYKQPELAVFEEDNNKADDKNENYEENNIAAPLEQNKENKISPDNAPASTEKNQIRNENNINDSKKIETKIEKKAEEYKPDNVKEKKEVKSEKISDKKDTKYNYDEDYNNLIEGTDKYDGVVIPEEEVTETSENSDVTDLNTLLKEANFLYNEKEFKAAYEKVNTYLEYATTDIDKGLLLKGQILEARSELQDIKGAIQIYNTLMKEYPASVHWDEANKRVIYLKRFYLEVR